MKEIYRDPDPAKVGFYQSILEEAGVTCFVRNQHADGSMFGAAAGIFSPALCVVNDDDYKVAMILLAEREYAEVSDQGPWSCAQCGEEVPGDFAVCWNCQSPMTVEDADAPGSETSSENV